MSAAVLAAACGSADASPITYLLGAEFSGGTPPAGSNPWLTATFEDNGANTVKLTLTATNLTGSEYVSGFYFNFNPDTSVSSLSFAEVSRVGSFTFDATSPSSDISLGTNAFQADGDGKYDVRFSFATAGGPGDQRFGAGDSLVVNITGVTGMTANSFNVLSAPAGGHGPFYVAAHVQGIGPEGKLSGWITDGGGGGGGFEIPEPTSIVLLGTGMLGAMYAGRRRRQAA